MDHLLEFFRSAREELLFRVKARDNYIKLQLIVQAILIGLTEGVNLGGVAAKNAMPYVTALSVPVSLIFWILYFTEDRLVGQISAYNRRLFENCGAFIETRTAIQCWDGSQEALAYLKLRDPFRFFVHITVFLIIPFLLFYRYYFDPGRVGAFVDVGFVLEAIGLVAIFLLILTDFAYRRRKRRSMMVESGKGEI